MPSPARAAFHNTTSEGNARFQRMVTTSNGCGSDSVSNSSGGVGAADIAARFSEGCWASDDESLRRTPVKRSPSSNRSFSFSVGTTPRAQYPSRMSISPTTSIGSSTPRRLLTTPTRTPSANSDRRKGKIPVDPMSVCKSAVKGNGIACRSSGKENAANLFNSSQKENASTLVADSPTARRRFHLSGASPKNVRMNSEHDGKAFDLMPPPMPRTPSGKGGNGGSLRSTPVLPLRKHDLNNRGRGDAAVSDGDVGVGPGRSENRGSYVETPSSPVASPRSGTFSLGSGDRGRGRLDLNSPRQNHSRTSSRGATAAAARCAPTPPRRSRSASATSGSRGQQHREQENGVNAAPGCGSSSVHPAPSGGIPSAGLKELLAGRAREFYEQGAAEALVGFPRDAVRSFTRAMKIVPEGWAGMTELLMARARALSALGKHEACAKDCRVALESAPSLLQGVTLMGHACLRLGLHDQSTRFLHEGLALAISQPDPVIMAEAQAACRLGIEEASVVAAALESGTRASSHGQHEVALAAAVRVMGIAPHCIVAQEMRASALLGLLRPMECAAFCQAGCVLPRSDPEDDSDWPLDTTQLSPVQVALSMAPGVARLYAMSLRGCGRECDVMPVIKALRCRDPSLTWCSQDIARWEMVRKLMDEGKQLSSTGDYDSAVVVFTQVLEGDVACVIPNAEAFCFRGSSRLGQGNALEALDDCYRALSLLSLEGGGDAPGGSWAPTRGMALLVRGRAYLALSRIAESISDLKGCLKCNPGLTEASEYLRQAEQRQVDAGLQRRQREKQEREKEARVAAAAAAAAEADRRAKEKAKKEREAAAAAAAAAAAKEKSRAADNARFSNESGRSTSSRPSGRPGSASPFRRPDPPGTRRGGGSASGGAAAAADGMKTPAKGTGVLRSPKIDSESYYKRLGVTKNASMEEIKKAYRKLALRYHPDKNKADDAASSFRLVSEAYRILTSPDSKQEYDRTRRYSIETPPSNDGKGRGTESSNSKNGRGGFSSPWSSPFGNVRGYGYNGTSGGRTRRHYDW